MLRASDDTMQGCSASSFMSVRLSSRGVTTDIDGAGKAKIGVRVFSRLTAYFVSLAQRVASDLAEAAERARALDPHAVAKRFERSRVPPWCWIVALWALFIFPAISLRAYHYEEGYTVAVARGVIENFDGLVPHVYGFRFVDRPNLMGWIVAALGMAAGTVNQWVARAPAVLSLLTGCFLVFHLVRRYASALAALFAALAFLVSPMVLQKMIVAEPDGLVSVLLLSAFIVWWNGVEAGSIGIGRWLGIGVLLAVAAFGKGPLPLAYFSLGAAAFHLLHREWIRLAGLVLAGAMAALAVGLWYWSIYQPGDLDAWMEHSRLMVHPAIAQRLRDSTWFTGQTLLELFPALIIAAPLVPRLWRPTGKPTDQLVLALFLYSACCTAVLLFWPGANSRYVMPAALTVAALAGLGFDRYRRESPALVNAALVVGALLALYQLVLCWLVMPGEPSLFDRSRRAASAISAAMVAHPATLYTPDRDPYNVLAYLRPVRIVPLEDFRTLEAPAWAIIKFSGQEQRMRALRPDLDITVAAVVEYDPGEPAHLLYLRPK